MMWCSVYLREKDTRFCIKAILEELPDWLHLYFASIPEKDSVKCNLCEIEFPAEPKLTQLEHVKEFHKDIYDLHKDNPEATVGFRVEFLHLNVLKDDGEVDPKAQPMILEEVCEATESEIVGEAQDPDSEVINMQYVMLDTKRKYRRTSTNTVARRRSWIWKYFDKLSNIVYRCNLCNVVLSIKGSNTNNLNRHMRSKHPDTFKIEKYGDLDTKDDLDLSAVETPYAIKTEEIYASNRDMSVSDTPTSQKLRRSWIWSYFDHVSATQAQCKLCHRQINHGGNATGNMNRHLKMIHHKTSSDNNWVWKVFDQEPNYYTCKICHHKLTRHNTAGDMVHIMYHLKKEHGVVSGDQIITGTECEIEEN